MIMKYKYIIIHLFAVLLCLPSALFAQLSVAEKNALNEQAKGFDFYFNAAPTSGINSMSVFIMELLPM